MAKQHHIRVSVKGKHGTRHHSKRVHHDCPIVAQQTYIAELELAPGEEIVAITVTVIKT